jgi:SAM-dependent methyltransferase
MGGYACKGYGSKEEFFETYLQNSKRHACYDAFLARHLPKEGHCLSIASGRAVNELRLMEQGWKFLCSDLDAICLEETLKLFPNYSFLKWDCMSDPLPEQRFDVVISLSFIYLLDPDKLQRFFRRMRELLLPGGVFLLDSAGSPDVLLGTLLHDYWLPVEASLGRPVLRAYYRLKGRGSFTVQRKHHGFRYKDQEIIAAAKAAAFQLEAFEAMDFETEWDRSLVYRHLLKRISPLRRVLLQLGKRLPYVRMFAFRRADGGRSHASPL